MQFSSLFHDLVQIAATLQHLEPKQPETNSLDNSFAVQVQVNDQFTLPPSYHSFVASGRYDGPDAPAFWVKSCETLWYRAGHTQTGTAPSLLFDGSAIIVVWETFALVKCSKFLVLATHTHINAHIFGTIFVYMYTHHIPFRRHFSYEFYWW